ncbi:MAG: type VI secretion system accessory protein TagJ [Myxococcota bacterium]
MARTPQQWLEDDNLTEARRAAERIIAEDPDDAGVRFMLFELCAVSEDFDEAARHLAALPPGYAAAREHYGGLLSAEKRRREVLLQATGQPGFLIQPPRHVHVHLGLIRRLADGDLDLVQRALDDLKLPPRSGTIDNDPFIGIRDCDDLLAPVIEFVVPGAYGWLPIAQLERITFVPPQGYPDVIWAPATVQLRGVKTEQLVKIPTLYVGTGQRSDTEMLGLETRWERPIEGMSRAFGQRDLIIETPDGQRTLKGIRQIQEIVFT